MLIGFYQQTSDVDLATNFIYQRIKNEQSVIFIAYNSCGNALGFTQLHSTFSSISAQSN
ncbi:hypothetical protein [Paraglaciecola polaris]|uniref:Uncharacterized protein n=1 Tax=Paraglaciecola polaris LMG 21857 TaxID=1129793 RepID=K6Z6X4_9ALTE|nr:hypothetical protein [Paraglaciecola polaris]GAC31936.1 hypothetical protein GPLA_1020 [Paraglaciecola polaris LMG 21857]